MKFVHTADWHIGMKFGSFDSEKAKAARKERLQAGSRVVEVANSHQADFIIVAGDLFQDNSVDRSLVMETASILSKFKGDVFIIPGNHDPLVPGSVWDHQPSWERYENVKIFRENKPEFLNSCVLYPCVATSKYNSNDPTAWIDAKSQGQISIGIAHGNIDALQNEAKDTPIAKDAASSSGLDYLALGHWHSTIIGDQLGAPRMAYSGSHETGSFGERDSGYVLVVEIEKRGSTPCITPIRTGMIEWKKEVKDIRLQSDLAAISRDISAIPSPANTILSLTLTGFVFPQTLDEIYHLILNFKDRFMSFNLDTSQLRPSPQNDDWLDVLPQGIIRITASELIEMSKGSDQTAEVAFAALMELYRISHEVAK